MSEAASRPPRMTVDEFIAWSEDKPGRHELLMGEVVTMQGERASHNLVKLAVAVSFRDALRQAGLRCTTFTDGITVRMDAHTSFEPDVTMDCGQLDPNSVFSANPVIVVEVISPSTSRIDTGMKFDAYFQLPSVMHYLVVNASKRIVVHHQRHGKAVLSMIVSGRAGEGTLTLDPPGITVPVADFFADLPPVGEDA